MLSLRSLVISHVMAWPCLAFFGAFQAVGIFAGRRFFALCLRGGSSPCHLLLAVFSRPLCIPCSLPAVCRITVVFVQLLAFLLGPFFTLCFHGCSSPCPCFFRLSLLMITPPSHHSGSYILPSRHSWRAPRLHTLLALWSSRLAAFLYAAALGGRPNVVRGSGFSGLFEVWLAVPVSGAASLAGQVSMRFAFAAVLLPATSTFVCCRGYFGCFPFSFLS